MHIFVRVESLMGLANLVKLGCEQTNFKINKARTILGNHAQLQNLKGYVPFSMNTWFFIFIKIESIPTSNPAKPNLVYMTQAQPGQVKSTKSRIAYHCNAKKTK